jgi:hypothetical protein
MQTFPRSAFFRFWHKSSAILMQVPVLLGAGIATYWRRCVFLLWTCAAKRAYTHSSGAGPQPFSTPAPADLGTCATDIIYLRQSARGLRGQGREDGIRLSASARTLLRESAAFEREEMGAPEGMTAFV